MPYLSRETRRLLFWFFLVAASAFLTEWLVPGRFPGRMLSSVLYCAVLTAWLLTVHKRILQPAVRRLLMAGASFLLVLFLLRMCRYVFFSGETAQRVLWYLYYIPLTALPLVSVEAALATVGRTSRPMSLGLWLGWAALCAGVLTNDLHHGVFVFPDPAQPNLAERGWLYRLVAVWSAALLLAAFLLLLRRVRLPQIRRLTWIPMLPVALALGMMGAYLANGGNAIQVLWGKLYQIQEVYLLLFVGLWEGCIQIGMIPSNSGYGEFFSHSTVRAVLADRDGRTVYRSWNALDLTPAQMENALMGSLLLGDHLRVRGRPVSGGAVYWAEDLTAIHQMNDELAEAAERIAGENQLLEAENEITARRTGYEIQNRLYDGIAETLRPWVERLDALLEEPRPDRAVIARAAVLGAFVKRRANLAVTAEGGGNLPAGELYLSVRESMEYLELTGVTCTVAPPPDCLLPCGWVLAAYEVFQQAVESALPGLSLLLVSFFGRGAGDFAMGLAMDRAPALPPDRAVPRPEVRLESRWEDDVFYLRLCRREEGEP